MLLLSDEISTHSDNILLLAFSTDLLQIHNSNNNVIYYLRDCVENCTPFNDPNEL